MTTHRGTPISLGTNAPIHHPTPPPAVCADPPHRWLLDSKGFGRCAKCPGERQFPVPGYVTFRETAHNLITPSVQDHTYTWTGSVGAPVKKRKGPQPKLSADAVRAIRASTLSASVEGARYGVRKNTIIDVRSLRTHKDVV